MYLDEMRNLRDWESLHGDNHAIMIPETCYNTRDSWEKRLGPPLEQFEPGDHQNHIEAAEVEVFNKRHDLNHFVVDLWKLLRCLGVQISAHVFSST